MPIPPGRRKDGVRRFGLVAQFGLLSLVLIGVLGVTLGLSGAQQIKNRAMNNARDAAVVTSRLGIQPHLDDTSMRFGLYDEQRAALDASVQTGQLHQFVLRMKVWNAKGLVVYSDSPELVGHSFAKSEHLSRALEGEIVSEISHASADENRQEHGLGDLLEVYVPITLAEGQPPAGAFELYLPYGPIAREIRHDVIERLAILAAGLGLLWLSLFRIVRGASRRLRQQAAENEHMAKHDALTGLPNRTAFQATANAGIEACRESSTGAAVFLMDLDRFKEINDTLGHDAGDRLLVAIGPRLQARVGAADLVARLGGDEFAVFLAGIQDPATALHVADDLRAALEEPFIVDDLSIQIEASVGVATYPDHGDDAAALMQRADVALYVAKEKRSGAARYDPASDPNSRRRLSRVAELRGAILERDELVVFYQPKADMASGDVHSVEALVRWDHPRDGLLAPMDFLPLAEHTGLIRPLTLSVLEAALTQCAAWRAGGIEVDVAVNLSVRTLHDPEFPGDVARLLAGAGLPPSVLVLEITESMLMADPVRAMETASRLHAMGVRLSIDDFGTGYSSLAYLKQLPVDELKIDRSFVMDMNTNPNDLVIVRSAIDLARNLGLTVVAEGVEDAATWDALRSLSCDQGQGYFLSRPVPGDELTRWMTERQRSRSISR
jgi:diguanylate cyclase (GGDEF)-like protein